MKKIFIRKDGVGRVELLSSVRFGLRNRLLLLDLETGKEFIMWEHSFLMNHEEAPSELNTRC